MSSSFAEFAVSRFVGYYATALNNSHLVLQHMQWPNRIPYETMEALWTAPGVKQAHLYQMLGGRPPPFSSGTDSMYFGVLDHFANPEFNNEGGYVTAFIDYGRWGGIVYFLLVGVIVGLLYRGFLHGRPFGLFLYPILFLGLLELPR